MTNAAIIMNEMILNNVTEEVDTYQGWQRRGMQVQKGSKALFKTKIWKPRKGAQAENSEELQEEELKSRFILVKAAFFGLSQVERVTT